MTKKIKRNIFSALCFTMFASVAVGGIMVNGANVQASAAESAKFYMKEGASVNLKTGYGGIRWTTTVNDAFLSANGYTEGDVTAQIDFGTLVAPVENITDLTLENASAEGSEIVNIKATGIDLSSGSATYYSAVRYDDIVASVQATNPEAKAEDILKDAYKLELTARSYVTINGETHYADATNVTRSARQVANAAVLAGELEKVAQEDKEVVTNRVNGYIGTATRAETEVLYELESNGPIATDYDGNEAEVVVGAQRMNASIENGVITFAEGQTFATGEQWISVFDDDGVYNIPAVVATKILTKAEDFAIFKANNDAWNGTGTLTEGYYVLGNDIDARNYVHGASAVGLNSANIEMWANGDGGAFGFTGTFDGRGHTVDGMEVSDYGIFGAVKNSTIKNVAFTQVFCDVNRSTGAGAVLGGFIAHSTLENIYIEVNATKEKLTNDNGVYYNGAFSVVSDFLNCDLTNCVFNMGNRLMTGLTSGWYYGSFARTNYFAMDSSEMENVYIVSNTLLNHRKRNTTDIPEIDAANTSQFTADATSKTTVDKIKRYASVAAMQADTSNDYSSFGDTWYLKDGMPVWNGTTDKGVTENEVSVVIDMFSAMDGDIDLAKAFGANEGDTIVLTNAYQESRALTVEDDKIKGVEPVFVMKDGKKDDVAIVPVMLVGTVNGTAKTVSVGLKAYTRVIDEATDLAMFVNTATTTAYTARTQTSYDGYYILGNNIDASSYAHQSQNDIFKSMGCSMLENEYMFGLRGTFDGNGYTIDGITINMHGLFGAVNGGVVKDLAMINVKLTSVASSSSFCSYAYDALFSNVYLEVDTNCTRGKWGYGVFALDTVQSTFRNVLVVAPEANTSTQKDTYGFGSFIGWVSEAGVTGKVSTYDNVYVISKTVLGQRLYNATGKTELKYFVDAENRTETTVSGYTKYYLTGVKRYDTASAAGNVAIEGASWSINNGAITWAK